MFLFKICNRIIEYSFYGLFLLVPLAFTSATSELFELNKMWLTWALTIIIGAAWFIKMILQRRILLCRTPLDIPIGLFLVSQIISTIFSLDFHVSLWGYYSRFNGGLLSILSYIFLYYAFVSNLLSKTIVKRLLIISLVSGLIVSLWGLPSHFGYDPTCFLFRGTFDVSCWTADFMPKIRIFSTLGQPDWLAAYLAILIPISIAYFLKKRNSLIINHLSLILLILFYVDLLFTRARSGILGVWISLIFLAALYYWTNGKPKLFISREKLKSPLSILIFGFLIITFIIGTPISQLNRFTLEGIGNYFQKTATPTPTPAQSFESGGPARNATQSVAGGTESGNIRFLVWQGAINAWKSSPLFGTGVETFAFAYYKYKPIGQNLTSEWNFLYNKAHNEYLNYLATTGIFGLGTYLLMIGSFLFIGIKALNSKHEARNPKQAQNSNNKSSKPFGYSDFKNSNLFRISNFEFRILPLALIASYVSILITNFFGFSVVMTNIYLFMIPAFVFALNNIIKDQSKDQRPETKDQNPNASVWQWTPIFLILIIGVFMLFSLFRFWQADIAFALGYNLDRAGEYQKAYPDLHKAAQLRGGEPVFKDELSVNDAIIAASLVSQKPKDSATSERTISVASSLAREAIDTSNEIISQHPNNAVFWKTRVKLFYTLSQVDSRYLPRALDAIVKASLLAPNDANIWYNLGVLYGQNNNLEKGISALEKTIQLKPDYRDAYYALGLFYHTASQDAKALAQMQYILEHIAPQDSGAIESIKSWK